MILEGGEPVYRSAIDKYYWAAWDRNLRYFYFKGYITNHGRLGKTYYIKGMKNGRDGNINDYSINNREIYNNLIKRATEACIIS